MKTILGGRGVEVVPASKLLAHPCAFATAIGPREPKLVALIPVVRLLLRVLLLKTVGE